MSVTKLFKRLLPALALALVAGACSDLETPSAPVMTAQYGVGNGAGNGNGSVTRSGGSSTLVQRDTPAERDSVYATIGVNGGELRAGGHELTIPRRAVTEPTVFMMRVLEGNYIHVELTATNVRTGEEVERFGTEVKLRLSWAEGKVADRRGLVMAYLVDDSVNGRQELLKTVVDVHGRFIDSRLTHLSQYAIAFD